MNPILRSLLRDYILIETFAITFSYRTVLRQRCLALRMNSQAATPNPLKRVPINVATRIQCVFNALWVSAGDFNHRQAIALKLFETLLNRVLENCPVASDYVAIVNFSV
jgi:hypothetical protein